MFHSCSSNFDNLTLLALYEGVDGLNLPVL